MRTLDLGRRFGGIVAWDSFFHLTRDEQRAVVPGLRPPPPARRRAPLHLRPRRRRGHRRRRRPPGPSREPLPRRLRRAAGGQRLRRRGPSSPRTPPAPATRSGWRGGLAKSVQGAGPSGVVGRERSILRRAPRYDIMIALGGRDGPACGRNLEDDVKTRLQERARRHGRSTEEEVRDILRHAVRDEGHEAGARDAHRGPLRRTGRRARTGRPARTAAAACRSAARSSHAPLAKPAADWLECRQIQPHRENPGGRGSAMGKGSSR